MRTAEYALLTLLVGALVLIAGTYVAGQISSAFERAAENVTAATAAR